VIEEVTEIEIARALSLASEFGENSLLFRVIRSLAFQRETESDLCYGAARSSQWGTVRDQFLEGKVCAICGGAEKLIAHHRLPFHSHPEYELDLENLVPLCEARRYGVNCHLLFGHLGNFRRINLDLDRDIETWSARFNRKDS
jgi:5-methylcytosine-specific restriction enzyme A